MSITTFAELKTAIENWEERTDFSAREDEFVALAEADIRRELARHNLRLREQETRTDVTPSSGTVTLPSDFQAMKTVQVRTSSPRRLEYKTMEWLNEAYPDGASGNPSFYGIVGGTLYMFPLSTSDMRLEYYAYPTALSGSTSANWLLTKYPDVYLYASLKQVKIYDMNEAGVARYDALFKGALASLSAAGFGAEMTPGTGRTAATTAW